MTQGGHEQENATERKAVMRAELRARRAKLTPPPTELLVERAKRIAWWSVVRGSGVVAAYASYGTEPSTRELLDALRDEGVRILLPVLLADGDLDWTPFRGHDAMENDARGVPVPTGGRLGLDAITGVDTVFLPALAVDSAGHRLGQGGGSYDRALRRIRDDVPVVALLHDGELLEPGAIPVEAHDLRVTHVVMPSTGIVAVGPTQPPTA